MLSITHVVVTLLLIQLMSLDRNDSFTAMLFGVFIDVDHFFGLKHYADTNGVLAIFNLDSLMSADGQWKSLLHNPIAIGIVGPLSACSKLAIPLLFWGVHMSMDFIEDAFLGVFSAIELAALCILVALLFTIRFRGYMLAGGSDSLRAFLRSELKSILTLRPQAY